MKTIIIFSGLFFWSTHCFSQQVGINTETPTESLDVNGGARFRNVPQTGRPGFIVSMDDTGRIYRLPYDSLDVSARASDVAILAINAGDTIRVGDCVAIGDGSTGLLRVNTYGFPATDVPITSMEWAMQTFVTGAKTIAIKAVMVDVGVQATNPASGITCSIRNVSGGVPSGADIGGRTAIGYGPAGGGFYTTFVRIVFDPPVTVSPNTNYALIIRNNMSGSFVSLRKQNLGMYANGMMGSSSNAGASWTTQPTFDLNCFVFECETQSGKAYPSDPSLMGSNVIGWNTTASCNEADGCPAGFYGKRDQYDNVVGIALHDALPGQMVSVQVGGFTDLITSFPLGRKLFLGTLPGKLATTGTKSVGISTGNGMIIQVTY